MDKAWETGAMAGVIDGKCKEEVGYVYLWGCAPGPPQGMVFAVRVSLDAGDEGRAIYA